MKRLFALLILPLTLAACGEKEEPTNAKPAVQRLTLMLDYFPNADHAGIYAAEATGAFRQAGLDVDVKAPSDPAQPLKLVAAGKADLAISYEPEVLLARDKGLRVASVAALVQKPLTSIMALGSAKVRDVADLEGKTVGTAGIPYQSAYLKTILTQAGVDPERVKEVNVGFNLVPAMLTKKVDATLGSFWNYEGVELRLKRKRPVVIRMERVGLPVYNELVVVAREEDLRRRGAVVRRFLLALARGHEAVRRDAETGIGPLLAANRDLDRKLQEASVRETLPVFFPEGKDLPWGWQEPSEWEAYGRWMVENDLLSKPPTPTSLTNEFLPGQGV